MSRLREFAPSTIARIVEMRAENTSVREIARRLTDAGIPAPRGGQWHPTTIQRVVTALGPTARPPLPISED